MGFGYFLVHSSEGGSLEGIILSLHGRDRKLVQNAPSIGQSHALPFAIARMNCKS